MFMFISFDLDQIFSVLYSCLELAYHALSVISMTKICGAKIFRDQFIHCQISFEHFFRSNELYDIRDQSHDTYSSSVFKLCIIKVLKML